jgi:uncharacterized protein YcaQ
MHYRGLLRIARREGGVRMYAPREANAAAADPAATMDRLLDIVVNKYAPLPERTLTQLAFLLASYGVPHWRDARKSALARAKGASVARDDRRQHLVLAGRREPAFAPPRRERRGAPARAIRPVVWDRRRFEIFWGWAYRFRGLHTPP